MMDEMFKHARNSYTRGLKTEPDERNYGVRVNLLSFLEWWKSCRKKKQRKQIRPSILESWIKQDPETQPGVKRRVRSAIVTENFERFSARGAQEPSPVWSEDALGESCAGPHAVNPKAGDTWGRPVEAVMAPQPKPAPSPPRKPRAQPAAGDDSGGSVDVGSPRARRVRKAAAAREDRDTPEMSGAAFEHIVPGGIRPPRDAPLKLPAVPGASPRGDFEEGFDGGGFGENGEGGELPVEGAEEGLTPRRVTGELLSPWQVRLRRKRLAEVAAAAREKGGPEKAAAVAAREHQRRWVPTSAVGAPPDPRMEARVGATDRLPVATSVDTLVMQDGCLGAPALNGESHAIRGLRAGMSKSKVRRAQTQRAEGRRVDAKQGAEAALSRLVHRTEY